MMILLKACVGIGVLIGTFCLGGCAACVMLISNSLVENDLDAANGVADALASFVGECKLLTIIVKAALVSAKKLAKFKKTN